MPSSERKQAAIRLRDAALGIMRRHGRFQKIGSATCLTACVGNLELLHTTPFQQLPGASEADKYAAARLGLRPEPNLPYGLTIGTPGKVFFVEWADWFDLTLLCFKRGHWEADLLRLAQDARPHQDTRGVMQHR